MIASYLVVSPLQIFVQMSAYSILSFITGKRNYMSKINLENNRPILYRLFSPVQIHSYQQKGRFSINRFLSIMPLPLVMFLKLFIPMELNYVFPLVQTSTSCDL